MERLISTTSNLSKNEIQRSINNEDSAINYLELKGYSEFLRIVHNEKETDYVKCKTCSKLLKYVSKQTNSSITKHECTKKVVNQLKITDFNLKVPSNKLKSECVSKVTDYIVKSNNSFHSVDHPSFIEMVQYFINVGKNGQYDAKQLVPHSTTISRNIDTKYIEKMNDLINFLSPLKDISIVLDHWENRYTNHKYIGELVKFLAHSQNHILQITQNDNSNSSSNLMDEDPMEIEDIQINGKLFFFFKMNYQPTINHSNQPTFDSTINQFAFSQLSNQMEYNQIPLNSLSSSNENRLLTIIKEI